MKVKLWGLRATVATSGGSGGGEMGSGIKGQELVSRKNHYKQICQMIL